MWCIILNIIVGVSYKQGHSAVKIFCYLRFVNFTWDNVKTHIPPPHLPFIHLFISTWARGFSFYSSDHDLSLLLLKLILELSQAWLVGAHQAGSCVFPPVFIILYFLIAPKCSRFILYLPCPHDSRISHFSKGKGWGYFLKRVADPSLPNDPLRLWFQCGWARPMAEAIL